MGLSAMQPGLILFLALILIILPADSIPAGDTADDRRTTMAVNSKTAERLREHLQALTVTIGERSVRFPQNLKKTSQYIQSFYREIGLVAHSEPYTYDGFTVTNVVAEILFTPNPSHHLLLGAHYDSVSGSPGADDNASAVAVQLETARNLKAMLGREKLDLAVKFVSFTLEEPPAYGTSSMGSRVYAAAAHKKKEKIDGMICLEMVGYACREPGCQKYPFPLMFFGYPKEGNFIGIVGNVKSRGFSKTLFRAFKKNPRLPAVKLTLPFNGWILPSVRLSDHASFWDKGFKAVMVTDSAFYRNPHYHTPTDTMEKLDYGFMAELVQSLLYFFLTYQG